MAQLLGIMSLIFVPIGILWLIHEIKNRRKEGAHGRTRFAVATLIVFCIVVAFVSFGAFSTDSFFLGIAILTLGSYAASKMFNKIKLIKNASSNRLHPMPFYLILIPAIVLLFRFLFIVPATEFSRNHAIRQTEPLIRDLEAYHQKHGHYPLSLHSVNKDYKPWVLGIKQFHYEPNGDAYNIYFEQFTYILDSKEIVMYNKLDQHFIHGHDMDILEYSGTELAIRRGDRRKFDLPQPHWTYFWFD